MRKEGMGGRKEGEGLWLRDFRSYPPGLREREGVQKEKQRERLHSHM